MKIATISQVGYNSPRNANWSYKIFKIDLIDTNKNLNSSLLTTSNFGGDERLKRKIKEITKTELIETQPVYTSTGTPKITGINKLPDIESEQIINEIIDHFL